MIAPGLVAGLLASLREPRITLGRIERVGYKAPLCVWLLRAG